MSSTTRTRLVREQPPAPEEKDVGLPSRDGAETKALLDDADALLDEIDAVLETEPVQALPITLGDLMRYGAERAPQAIGSWRGSNGETCALSAAYEGARAIGFLP